MGVLAQAAGDCVPSQRGHKSAESLIRQQSRNNCHIPSSCAMPSTRRAVEAAEEQPHPSGRSLRPRRQKKASDPAPAPKKKTKKVLSPPATPPTPPSEDEDQTDPMLVTRPAMEFVHSTMVNICFVYPHRQMCVIFDVVNPLRQFKRGMLHTDDPAVPFPIYDPSPEGDPNVTESDVEPGLMQYRPLIPESCVSLVQSTSLVGHHSCIVIPFQL